MFRTWWSFFWSPSGRRNHPATVTHHSAMELPASPSNYHESLSAAELQRWLRNVYLRYNPSLLPQARTSKCSDIKEHIGHLSAIICLLMAFCCRDFAEMECTRQGSWIHGEVQRQRVITRWKCLSEIQSLTPARMAQNQLKMTRRCLARSVTVKLTFIVGGGSLGESGTQAVPPEFQ